MVMELSQEHVRETNGKVRTFKGKTKGEERKSSQISLILTFEDCDLTLYLKKRKKKARIGDYRKVFTVVLFYCCTANIYYTLYMPVG